MLGSGAFTTVTANRSVTVSVADDSGALLKMDATSSNENSAYADESGNDIVVDVAGASGSTGSGVNDNATTEIFDIFDIVNQGTQPAIVYADPASLGPDAFAKEGADDTDGIYLDPQVSDMPNVDQDTDGIGYLRDGTPFASFTGIGGSVLPGSFADNVLETGNTNVAADPEAYLLNPGQSFEFGLNIQTSDAAVDSFEFNVDIVADAGLAEQAGLDGA